MHLIAEQRTTDPEQLAAYFGGHQIDCLKIVPTHLSALLSAARPAALLPRRRLVRLGLRNRIVVAFALFGAVNWIPRWYNPQGTSSSQAIVTVPPSTDSAPSGRDPLAVGDVGEPEGAPQLRRGLLGYAAPHRHLGGAPHENRERQGTEHAHAMRSQSRASS